MALEEANRRITSRTYTHLRLMLWLIPAFIVAGGLLLAFSQGTIAGSISAYYLGPIRDVFVGCMFAMAACLTAYYGQTRYEDQLLNLAGFFAVVVALVPTGFAQTLDALEATPTLDALAGPGQGNAVNALRVSLAALLIIAAIFLFTTNRSRSQASYDLPLTGLAAKAIQVANGIGILFSAFLVWRMIEGADFAGIHATAAILLVVCLAATVFAYAFPKRIMKHPPEYSNDYLKRTRLIFWLMTAGAIACFLVALLVWPDYKILIIELWVLVLFVAFWVSETRRVAAELDAAHVRASHKTSGFPSTHA